MSASNSTPVPDHDPPSRTWRGSRAALFIGMAAGLLSVSLYSAFGGTTGDLPSSLRKVGFALSVAGAALLMGTLVGFLFGVPLSANEPSSTPEGTGRAPSTTQGGASAEEPSARRVPVPYRHNTNLEEISNWLTKILVGVGLVEFENIRSGLVRMARAIQFGGPPEQDTAAALAVLLYFSTCGFFLGYLWTRLNLEHLLSESELETARLRGMKEGRRAGEVELATQQLATRHVAAPRGIAPSRDESTSGLTALWVDDFPGNNVIEREILGKQFGLLWETATSTREAEAKLNSSNVYAFVVTDMSRPEGREAGYDLLPTTQTRGLPLIVYSSDGDRWDATARARGAFGSAGTLARLTKLVDSALDFTRTRAQSADQSPPEEGP